MTMPKPRDRAADDHHPRSRLGRGLAALLADTTQTGDPEQVDRREQKSVAIEFLRPNPRNPRRQFAADDLSDLAESIRAKGIIQPIVVRAIANVAGSYEIVAGERRWRAAQTAELTDVPVVVVEADDREALAFAIIENVQRADLNPIEEALGYQRLGQDFGYSQTELSAMIGKSRSHVANTMRLLNLPETLLAMVSDGRLSAGHARALLAFDDPEPVARRTIEEGLTVRDVEQLAQRHNAAASDDGEISPAKSRRSAAQPEARAIAQAFSTALGLAVSHNMKGETGEIRIRYQSAEQLDKLRRQLGVAG